MQKLLFNVQFSSFCKYFLFSLSLRIFCSRVLIFVFITCSFALTSIFMYLLADLANFVPPIFVFNLIIFNIPNSLISCDLFISFGIIGFIGMTTSSTFAFSTSPLLRKYSYWVVFSYFRCFPETESGHLRIQYGVQGQCLASLHYFDYGNIHM